MGERTATGGTSRAPFHTVELEMGSTIPMGWGKRGGEWEEEGWEWEEEWEPEED